MQEPISSEGANEVDEDPTKVEVEENLSHVTLGQTGEEASEMPGEEQEKSTEKESTYISRLKNKVESWFSKYQRHIVFSIKATLFLIYNAFLITATLKSWTITDNYCHGIKFLLLITIFVYYLCMYYYFLKPYVLSAAENFSAPLRSLNRLFSNRFTTWTVQSLIFLTIVTFILVDTAGDRQRLISAGGIFVLVLLGYIFSNNKKQITWKQVFSGLVLQFVFGIITLRWQYGRDVFNCFGEKINSLLEFTESGSGFVFGYLVTGKFQGDVPQQFAIFAFKVLPVILFFNFCVSILYYYGIMQRIVMKIGWLLEATLHTTACESISAAGNIFVGMTEAPLLIKPYIPILTNSELHAVMTAGFATIAGGVMAAFINFGISASHLLTASVMSAPAALACSKLLYPETEISRSRSQDIKIEAGSEQNAIEAAVNGASQTISLMSNIAVNLIAFLAFIQLLDSMIIWLGNMVGWDFLSFDWLLSKLFVPICLIMGIEWKDCEDVGRLIGLKTTINEFVAYQNLAVAISQKKLSARSIAISTYALCGFSNFSSIGIQLGALGAVAPERKPDLARLGLRAMIAGCVACLMTACVAGTLIDASQESMQNTNSINITSL